MNEQMGSIMGSGQNKHELKDHLDRNLSEIYSINMSNLLVLSLWCFRFETIVRFVSATNWKCKCFEDHFSTIEKKPSLVV